MIKVESRLSLVRTLASQHATGSLVKGRIIEQGPQESARNLRTAVIAVESTNHGLLSGVRYYARRQPEGGMPLASCSASQRGHLLRVPFRARYVFYR